MNNISIKTIWFDEGRIYMRDSAGQTHSRPLEAFPLLMDADSKQRQEYIIDPQGDAVRWPEIDEDIHISSFLEEKEPDSDNEIAQIDMSPGTKQTLTVSEAAEILGVSKPMGYSLIRDGSIPAINVGKKILISKLVLSVWLKNGGYYGEETC